MSGADSTNHAAIDEHICCEATLSTQSRRPAPDAHWHRTARWARRLSWASLVWMLTEGVVGLWQGLIVGSIALTGWALGSAVEGLASVIVIWRFTGSRTLSETAERRAQRGVAVSFWLLAPYIAAESIHHLDDRRPAEPTVIGVVLTGIALLAMPILGRAKHILGTRLGSTATAGEGTQNYLCAAQAAAVLTGLVITASWPDGWWLDPVIGLGIATAAVWEGIQSWRGDDCCAHQPAIASNRNREHETTGTVPH
ncbi:MAG TPA: cation transporter [Candidatus Baltobacteraceae bacterium]|nr:cation transporter [Candidatus Baltobacteraceae bacterium]